MIFIRADYRNVNEGFFTGTPRNLPVATTLKKMSLFFPSVSSCIETLPEEWGSVCAFRMVTRSEEHNFVQITTL